jgi:hypothetical protein
MNRWTYLRIWCQSIIVGLVAGLITYLAITLIVNPLQKETPLAKETQSEIVATQRYGTETYWQDIIQKEIGGEKEYRLDDGTRVDLLFEDKACEIDWANKWAEGIGQSIYYGLKTDRPPLVILLAKKDGWEKYRDRVEYCKIECWVYDTRMEGWVDND